MTDYESSLIAKSYVGSGSSDSRSLSSPIFVLCDRCYWCATYFDRTRMPQADSCPECIERDNSNDSNSDNTELTSFPILSNESFTFNYSDRTGVELEFKPTRKDR